MDTSFVMTLLQIIIDTPPPLLKFGLFSDYMFITLSISFLLL